MSVNYVATLEHLGIQKGGRNLLLRQLQHKFSNIPETYKQKIEQADADTLLVWGERVLDCQHLDDVFKEKMSGNYVTTFERFGIQKGGRDLLLHQLHHKFSDVPDPYKQKLEQAGTDILLVWGERVLDCQHLDDVFKA